MILSNRFTIILFYILIDLRKYFETFKQIIWILFLYILIDLQKYIWYNLIDLRKYFSYTLIALGKYSEIIQIYLRKYFYIFVPITKKKSLIQSNRFTKVF